MVMKRKAAMLIGAVALVAGAAAGAVAATSGGGNSADGTSYLDAARAIVSVERSQVDGTADPAPEVVGARVAVGVGVQGTVDFETGGRIDTPSGTFVEVTSKTFAAGSGPIVVRFAAEGYEEDWNRRAEFVGKSYAAMKVRVLLNGVPLAPGAVTLLDNGGKIDERSSLQGSRASAASFDWAGTVSAPGSQTVTVEFRNLHTWDSATLLRWTLTIQHA